MQIIDDIRIPYENNDTGAILEPLTRYFPVYGDGGYSQAKTDSIVTFIEDGLKILGD